MDQNWCKRRNMFR